MHLRRDCCDPVEAVARASRAEVARPDHSHLGTRVELSVNALHLRRVVARVLAELEKFFLDLLLGSQLDAQGELEEPRCLRVRLDARDHELHVVTQLGDHGLTALASVTKAAFDVENARLRRYVDVDRGLQLARADQLLQLDLGAHRDTEQLEALRREHGVAVARVHDPTVIFFWSADSELRTLPLSRARSRGVGGINTIIRIIVTISYTIPVVRLCKKKVRNFLSHDPNTFVFFS